MYFSLWTFSRPLLPEWVAKCKGDRLWVIFDPAGVSPVRGALLVAPGAGAAASGPAGSAG